MDFLEYELTAPTLCLGDRPKGGIFRPCDTRTIRYSSVTGALRSYFRDDNLHAAGYLVASETHNVLEHLVYSPQDRVRGISKVPITAQFLTNVLGRIFIRASVQLPAVFDMAMGALKSRGLGQCHLRYLASVEGRIVQGELLTRIPNDLQPEFEIRRVMKPVYGYLFRRTSPTDGVYVLSLFEGSVVAGPHFLVKEVAGG